MLNKHFNKFQDHTGYKMALGDIRSGIFLPRYYNPEIQQTLEELNKTHNLFTFGELIKNKFIQVSSGNEIGKMAYGTGLIPFVRTSDVSNGELKADAKQGVSEKIFNKYGPSQNVQAGDIFFVRDGTYLIGQSAIVTKPDLPLLYQSHILKFRVKNNSPISSSLLYATLNSPIVKKQIKAKCFTADIIDTIGDRYRELVLPIPKDREIAERISSEVEEIVAERSRLLDKIRKIPYWAQGYIKSIDEDIPNDALWEVNEKGNPGFLRRFKNLRNIIFMPKYYDPEVEKETAALSNTHRLESFSKLVKEGIISWKTGIEVGKMAYGTGDIPFIRTSDISNWELKGDPKQNVSEEIYIENEQDIHSEDIFIVRDGTYLVGTSCILTKNDTKILYCGGLYKIRIEKSDKLDAFLLLALLNMPNVRRQMKTKQFTRDIIDTLGKRIFEIIIPIPKDMDVCSNIAMVTRKVIENRAMLRDRIKKIAFEIEGKSLNIENDKVILEEV